MDLQVLFRGFVVGIALAAPVGPIAILVVKRSLSDGAVVGIASGLGVAVADAIYAAVGALGLASLGLASSGFVFRIAGGLFLVGLGARTLFSASPPRAAAGTRVSRRRAFLGTLLYTLANPISILSFAAVAASLRGDVFSLASGVFFGSLTWWLLLATVAGLLRARVSDRLFSWANRAAGVALVVFGVVALAQR